MGCVCFVVLFLLALDVERIECNLTQLDQPGALHDHYVFEVPLKNDTEAEDTERISPRFQRYATSRPKSTTTGTPHHVDVVAIPLVPGLPALPPHMNKPPANRDDEVFTCEAIVPQPWQRLPTKTPKVHTKTPPTNPTPLPTKPVRTTQPSITKSTPTPSQNGDSELGKVSAFDPDEGRNISSQKTTPSKSPTQENGNTNKNDDKAANEAIKDDKKQKTSPVVPSQEKDDNKDNNESKSVKDKGKDDKKPENTTSKSPNQEDNNKTKNDNKDDGHKINDNLETTTSKQTDNNKTKNDSNVEKHEETTTVKLPQQNDDTKSENNSNGNMKNIATSTTAKTPQQQEKNENKYTTSTTTPPKKSNKNENQSNNNKNINKGGSEKGSTDVTNSVADSNNPPVGGGGNGATGGIFDTGKDIVGGVAGAGVVGSIIVGGSGLGVLGEGAGTITGVAGGAAGVSGSSVGGGGSSASGNAAGETPANSVKQPQQNKPKNNNSDKNTKDKEKDKGKEDDSDNDFDFDLDDLFDEDDFIDYTKFEVKSHSISDVAVIFADKFKRLEHVCEWFTNNFTNELNNLTVFQNKYFDMAAKVQTIRQNLGDMIEEETDDDIYNQKLEAFNVGALFDERLEAFQQEIDHIHTIVSQFSDAASIIEDEAFRIKTRIVEIILSAAGFTHHLYRDVGGVRVLTTVAQLRTTDCLSPYIPIYRNWRNAMKRLYLEGIKLERDTYKSLSGDDYTNTIEWQKVEGKFIEFIDRSKNELEGVRHNVNALRDPIYECVIKVAEYMFYKAQKVAEEVKKHVVFN